MKNLFTLYIDIKNTLEIKGQRKTVRMLAFSGRAEGDSFNGEILPCAVDMQTLSKDGNGSLSARADVLERIKMYFEDKLL